MRLAWRELLRRPGSFLVPVGTLLLLALLLLYPSAILDGVVEDGTAALRRAPADLVVYTRDANGVIWRSRIEPTTRDGIAALPGVAKVATFDVVLFTGKVSGQVDPVALAVLASDQPIGSAVPAPGQALADASLRGESGITEGSELLVGPFRVPVTVVGFTTGTNLLFAGGLVVAKSTWLQTLGQAPVGDGTAVGASQALLVTIKSGADADEVAGAIDDATAGTTQTRTRAAAVRAMPGVAQQESTFGYIRLVTLTVALVVVGLFLSFMTLERTPLYAVMKAVGASSTQLLTGMFLQVVWITDLAVSAAVLVTWGLTKLPLGLPTELRLARVIETGVALRTAALVGSALSLRRVTRIDPADAIG